MTPLISCPWKHHEEFGWYNRNTGYNPFTAEGKKTAAYEIWEQVLLANQLDRPLCVFVSVGDGNIISGIHKGFKDLYRDRTDQSHASNIWLPIDWFSSDL